MGALASILLTLVSVAASYGLQAGIEKLDRDKVRKNKMTPDQMISLINRKLAQIQRESTEAYNSAMDRLSSMPVIMEAGSLKNYMNQVRSMASNKVKAARQNLNDVENAVSDIKNRTANLAIQPDSYKASDSGKKEYQQIKSDADNLINHFSKEVSNVEKAI